MARIRGLFPVALAVGFGVLNGYMTFAPAFKNLEDEKKHVEVHGDGSRIPDPATTTTAPSSTESTKDAQKSSTEQSKPQLAAASS
ncbi:hypothetical protein FQN51_006552 [Onygenales sp. PD_10]|nr:hypothetical protein FQN51_006552 [Onygenales sp. PD_10]